MHSNVGTALPQPLSTCNHRRPSPQPSSVLTCRHGDGEAHSALEVGCEGQRLHPHRGVGQLAVAEAGGHKQEEQEVQELWGERDQALPWRVRTGGCELQGEGRNEALRRRQA